MNEREAADAWNALEHEERSQIYQAWRDQMWAGEVAAQRKWFAQNYADFNANDPAWNDKVEEAAEQDLVYEFASMDYADRFPAVDTAREEGCRYERAFGDGSDLA